MEFNIKENAEKNGDEMVDLLILIAFEALFDKYSIEGDTNSVVELGSSTNGTHSIKNYYFFFFYSFFYNGF